MQFRGGGEGVAQRTIYPDVLPRLQLAEAVGSRADALDEEVEAEAGLVGGGFGDGEGAGQEGALAVLLPVMLAGEHVELAGIGLGALFVEQGEESVTARLPVCRNRAEAAAERGLIRGPRTRERMPVHI